MRDDDFRICGTAMASMGRMSRLRAVVERLAVTVTPSGDRLVVDVHNTGDAFASQLNVHHSATADGGYPFLDSKYGVSIGPGETVRLDFAALGRTGPFHIVFQDADAFEARTIG